MLQTLTDDKLISAKKLGITGESGSGKTHKLLEAMVWARSKVKSADELMFAFIDCDDGIRKLIARGLLPKELRPRIKYCLYTDDWKGIRKDTKEQVPILKDWARDHGPYSSWVMVDNGAKVWDWLQDDLTLDVYGKTRTQMMREARVEAVSAGNKSKPVLSQLHDYGVLSREFYTWWDPLQFSDINVIITAPAWLTREKQDDGTTTVTDVNMKGVQPDLVHRLDELFFCYEPSKNKDTEEHLSSLLKRRTTSKKFSNVAGLSFTSWMKFCEKYALEEPLVIPQ